MLRFDQKLNQECRQMFDCYTGYKRQARTATQERLIEYLDRFIEQSTTNCFPQFDVACASEQSKTHNLCTSEKGADKLKACCKRIDRRLHDNEQPDAALKVKTMLRPQSETANKLKPKELISYGNVVSLKRLTSKINKSNLDLQKRDFSANDNCKAASSVEVVRSKCCTPPSSKEKPSSLLLGRTTKCQQYTHNYEAENLSDEVRPVIRTAKSSIGSHMLPLRKNVNENAKKCRANTICVAPSYEPRSIFSLDDRDACGSSVCQNECLNDESSISTLKDGNLYHSCFPMLVKYCPGVPLSRGKRIHRRPYMKTDEVLQKHTEEIGVFGHHRQFSHTSPCCARKSCGKIKPANVDFDCRNTYQGGFHPSDLAKNDERHSHRSITSNSSFESKDVKAQIRNLKYKSKKQLSTVMNDKLGHNPSQCQCQVVTRKPSPCNNVWRSIIRYRDLKHNSARADCNSGSPTNEVSDKLKPKKPSKVYNAKENENIAPVKDETDGKGDAQSGVDVDALSLSMVKETRTEASVSDLIKNLLDSNDNRNEKAKKSNRRFGGYSRSLRSYLKQIPIERNEMVFAAYTSLLNNKEDVSPQGNRTSSKDTANFESNVSVDHSIPSETGGTVGYNGNCQERVPSSQTFCWTQPVTRSIRIPYHETTEALSCDAIPDSTKWDCRVKGYEIIHRLQRDAPSRFCSLLLASNTRCPTFSPVEVIAYVQPYTRLLTSTYSSDYRTGNEQTIHNSAIAMPQHKNLVTLLHRFCTKSMVYQITEHFPWPSLTKLISTSFDGLLETQRKGLAESTRISIFQQICKGMKHLHLFGVVHGGLRCDNILVSDKLEVKLADYGLACQRWAVTYDQDKDRVIPRGSPLDSYTPPEMMTTSSNWTKSCDVWCMGMALLEMTLGEIPMSLNTAVRLSGSTKKLERVGLDSCGYQLTLLIDKILQCRPSQRPTVSMISQHAWLSDGTDLAKKLTSDSAKVAKRTDGSTFPLPKRIQNMALPTPEAFYDSSDPDSSGHEASITDYIVDLPRSSQEARSDSCVASSALFGGPLETKSESRDSRRYSASNIECTSGGQEWDDVSDCEEQQAYSKPPTGDIEEKDNKDQETESQKTKGFLSCLVDSLDKSASVVVSGRQRRKVKGGDYSGSSSRATRRKKVKTSRSSGSPSVSPDRFRASKNSPSNAKRPPVTKWSGRFQQYLVSNRSQATSVRYSSEDRLGTSHFSDCNDEFVMEDDDKALEEIESLIKREEQEFWFRELGKCSQGAT